MTVREVYEYILIELNKVKSPHIHLEDFLYFINKAIQEYINERYTLYAVSQQLTDDLEALSKSFSLNISGNTATINDLVNGSLIETVPVNYSTKYGSSAVTIQLPSSYLHLLLCVCNIVSNKPYKCYGAGYTYTNSADRLTSDLAGGIMSNAYLKPALTRPYFQINDNVTGAVTPSITILYGLHPITNFTLTKIELDFLKKPEVLNLSITQRDSIVDTSATLEFPEYVCNELIKRAVKLVLENSTDPRLQTNPLVNKTI